MDSHQAAGLLSTADAVGRRTDRAARWYARYATVYAAASVACGMVIGLVANEPLAFAVFAVVWGGAVAGLSIYVARQRVAPRNFSKVHVGMIVSWVVVWTVLVFGGDAWFPADPLWYVPGALVTAIPPAVAAVLIHRAAWKEERR